MVNTHKPLFMKRWAWLMSMLVAGTLISGCSASEESEVNETSVETEIESPTEVEEVEEDDNSMSVVQYEIVKEEDISIGNSTRRMYWVYPLFGEMTDQEIEETSKVIIEGLKTEFDFSAISLFYVDTTEDPIGHQYGMVEYAPNGVWFDADTVEDGDYSTHDYLFKYDGDGSQITEDTADVEEDEQTTETENDEDTYELTFQEIPEELQDLSVTDTREDVTGNWRKVVTANNVNMPENALAYNQEYMNDGEIHHVISFATNTTTMINNTGGILTVNITEYQDKEEHSADTIGSGMLLKSYIVYEDSGEIVDLDNEE